MPEAIIYRLTCAVLVKKPVGIEGKFTGQFTLSPGEYIIGDIYAASQLHAVNRYWKRCPHVRPKIMDEEGKIIQSCPLKMREIMARPKAEGAPPIPENVVVKKTEAPASEEPFKIKPTQILARRISP